MLIFYFWSSHILVIFKIYVIKLMSSLTSLFWHLARQEFNLDKSHLISAYTQRNIWLDLSFILKLMYKKLSISSNIVIDCRRLMSVSHHNYIEHSFLEAYKCTRAFARRGCNQREDFVIYGVHSLLMLKYLLYLWCV